ncbi:competence protein CoiA family protein [Bacillus sp. E(2018)]|uniref:competence protein CoiA n=1 Tax=Bacillus sp. E(2018) TaxID=2502239 RepID=UPI0010F6DD06|nr:competence protein CoiA family protein [Bacillus sp. E(2018)]
MLVALFNDQYVDMVGEITKEEWYLKNKSGKLRCPVCQNKVIPKCGTKKTWHFAHHSFEECEGFHEGETDYHLLGKKGLYKWLTHVNEKTILEHYIREIKQRPDLFLQENQHVIEFQCATVTPEDLRKRISGYQSLHITSDWIFGMKRIKQKGPDLFYMQSSDLSAAKIDSNSQLYLNFYCPLKEQFLLLRNIIPLSQKKVAAHGNVFSMKKCCDVLWLSQTFLNLETHNLNHKTLWKKQKYTWRKTAFKNTSPAVMYMKKVLYFNHHSLTLFPSIAGIPTNNFFHIETSPYLWQTYILILIDKVPISLFSSKFIEQEFQRLLQKRIFQTREFPYLNESWMDAVENYLSFLVDHHLLKKVSEGTYRKLQRVHYPKTLDEAFKLDEIFSEKS